MILVDASVWIDHLRAPIVKLNHVLSAFEALVHPFVLGEVALGSIRNREHVLRQLQTLPAAPVAFDHEVLMLIERHSLHGSGIGYVDAHLLAAVRLADGATLWTRDRRLHAAAARLGIAAVEGRAA